MSIIFLFCLTIYFILQFILKKILTEFSEETSGSIFEESSLWVSESRGGGESRDGEEILVEFVTREPHSSNQRKRAYTNNTI